MVDSVFAEATSQVVAKTTAVDAAMMSALRVSTPDLLPSCCRRSHSASCCRRPWTRAS